MYMGVLFDAYLYHMPTLPFEARRESLVQCLQMVVMLWESIWSLCKSSLGSQLPAISCWSPKLSPLPGLLKASLSLLLCSVFVLYLDCRFLQVAFLQFS